MATIPHLLLLLLHLSPVACAVYPEGAHLEPGFDLSSLAVHRSYQRPSPGCPEVLETVTEYEYDWRDGQGRVVQSLLAKSVQPAQELQLGNDKIKIYPNLNCLKQDDKNLIDIIKTRFLHPPSIVPSWMSSYFYGTQVGTQ